MKASSSCFSAALPSQTSDDRGGDRRVKYRVWLRGGGHFSIAHCDPDDVQRARAIFIQSVGDPLAVAAQVPAIDIPLFVRQEISMRFGCEIDVGEALKFRVPVRRDENAFAILGKERLRVGDLFSVLGWAGR